MFFFSRDFLLLTRGEGRTVGAGLDFELQLGKNSQEQTRSVGRYQSRLAI
jgi:hypothetical protein